MPIARIKSVYSCNSEDEHFPAENLLKEGKKWKCAEPGIDAAYVILQLEKPSKITGIDIGNEGSAYITVFVGKSGWTEDRYKEILLTSTFMTPAEARNMDHTNRVRCYSSDILVENVRDDKWDMVKILCTQSYNRKVKYGLAFVKIQTSDELNANASIKPNSTTDPIESTDENTHETESKGAKLNTSCDDALGLPKDNIFSQFKFREESSDSDNEPASLFNKWKTETKSDNPNESVISTAAAIRDSSSSISALEKSITIKKMTPNRRSSQDKPTASASDNTDDKKKTPVPNRNRYALIYEDEDDTTSDPKLEKLINADKERIEKEKSDRLTAKKKKDTKFDSKKEKNNEKMASSADKFKQFLDADNSNDNKPNKIETSNGKNDSTQIASVESDQLALSQAPNASQSSQETPNVAKRRSTAIDSSADSSPMKRAKVLNNDDDNDDDDDEIPFNSILRGTTFVISGIQNPERAILREKAIKMGAWYKADWDNSCTHLICAFPNTPKYKQVQAVNGKIVKREWITDCFDQKKKLPWQQYVL